MNFFAVKTDVHVWRSPILRRLDACMANAGATLIDLPWDEFELYKHDSDHFTRKGYDRFVQAFAKALARTGLQRVLVLADSTIDYHNWNATTYTGTANALLIKTMRKHGVDAVVDAVSGSGFVALHDRNQSFGHRLLRHRLRGCPHVVVVGGWNDVGFTEEKTHRACKLLFKHGRVRGNASDSRASR